MAAPPLMTFCRQLLGDEPFDGPSEPVEDPKSKAKGKKKEEPVVPEGEFVPLVPEEATLDLQGLALWRHPAIISALCSHGGLLCRQRVHLGLRLDSLDAPALHASTQV